MTNKETQIRYLITCHCSMQLASPPKLNGLPKTLPNRQPYFGCFLWNKIQSPFTHSIIRAQVPYDDPVAKCTKNTQHFTPLAWTCSPRVDFEWYPKGFILLQLKLSSNCAPPKKVSTLQFKPGLHFQPPFKWTTSWNKFRPGRLGEISYCIQVHLDSIQHKKERKDPYKFVADASQWLGWQDKFEVSRTCLWCQINS